MDNKAIGANIRKARKEKGMTQKELGAAVLRTESSIAKYEQGLVEIPNNVLSSIAGALGVHVFDLMDPDGILDKSKVLLRKYGQTFSPDTATLPDELKDLATKGPRDIYDALTDEGKLLLLAQFNRINEAPTQPNVVVHEGTPPVEMEAQGIRGDGQEPTKGRRAYAKVPVRKLSAAEVRPSYQNDNVSFSYSRREEIQKLLKALEGEPMEVDLGGSCVDVTYFHPKARIAAALDKLNEEGQAIAAERVEELTEIPRYQAPQPPQQAPQSTPASPEGKDTTPPETPSDGPQEPLSRNPDGVMLVDVRDGTATIEMICPICGQQLGKDAETGNAYCLHCGRSFPFPIKAPDPEPKINSPRP